MRGAEPENPSAGDLNHHYKPTLNIQCRTRRMVSPVTCAPNDAEYQTVAQGPSGTNVEGGTGMVGAFPAPAINHHTEVSQGSIKLPWLRGLVAFSKQRVRGRKHVAIIG